MFAKLHWVFSVINYMVAGGMVMAWVVGNLEPVTAIGITLLNVLAGVYNDARCRQL